MRPKNVYLIISIILVLVLIFLYFFIKKQNSPKIQATSTNSSITTTAQWDEGSKSNLLTSDGQMTINNKLTTSLDLAAIAAADPASVSTDFDESSKGNLVDGNIATFAETYISIPAAEQHTWWQIDLGGTRQVKQVRVNVNYFESNRWKIQTSTDGAIFTDQSAYFQVAGWQDVNFSAQAKYIRIEVKHDGIWGMAPNPPPWDVPPYPQPASVLRINQVEASATGFATHITGATQIDGGENFWEWTTFTPTQTTPANTSITYRYRTSANGTDWTAWVADIGSVTSRSGDTKYRYLQVEATLTNTDGASTPTIDSYDIDYHTEIKPTAPSAQTAVVR